MHFISSDVAFTHSNPVVHQACQIYSIATILLIQDPESPDRATKAFEFVLQISKNKKYDEITEWLEYFKIISDKEKAAQ